MKIKIALLACLNLAFGLNVAHAEHDSFWYVYPMPQAYLYVQDPVRYALWSAYYGDQAARSPVYRPLMVTHDRSRYRRRACEIRVLAGHRR